MERLVGTVLNNTYRIDKLLGQGGMGAVFRARDVALDRDVAIKLMHSHIASQQGFRERFLQEARAIAALSHPGIVPIYSFSSDPQQLYIVMAFIPGQNLADWLHLLSERQQTMSLPEALGIVELVAEALASAHHRGVYHRDIKPGNIILKPLESGQVNEAGLTFQPIVTDFGLAKLAEGGVHSMAGMSMGTPAYMAPEQCEAKPIDGRADIYSLGVVLYELVTGRVPFPVSTLTEALRAHTQEPPPPPRAVAPDLPSPIERIILKALAKRMEDRFQTASEMAEAVRMARVGLGPSQADATVTPARSGHASLVTMMVQETPPPTPKESEWPTPPSDIESGPQVLVLGPDGRSTVVAFGARHALTVGRDVANSIPLNDAQVSRQHCQITSDGGRFFVTDLNSTNGTFLGENKLLPGVSEPWRPGQSVRVGGHWLRLRLTEAGASQPAPEKAHAAPRAPSHPVALTIEPDRVAVEPGKSATLTLRVLNLQQQVDHFSVLVVNLPPEWVALPSQPLRLAPGDTGTLSLRLSPPRDATSLSGDHVFDVRVISRADPTITAQATAVCAIAPFRAMSVGLQPGTFVNAGQGKLTVTNLGNSVETVALVLVDPADVLDIPPAGQQLTLQAGQQQQVTLNLRARKKRPLMGNPTTTAFQVQARSGDIPLSVADGSFTVRPILPIWAIPLLITVVLLLAASIAMAAARSQQAKSAQKTAIAMGINQATQTAEAILAINATQTAQALAAFQTATTQAQATVNAQVTAAAQVTATAQWLASDPDGDGLTNAQELAYGTNPQNMDTDGDTLPDGSEIQAGTSPINKDTDGDGQQDNVDPSPGELPTLTPSPTATATATLTPSPTSTPVHAFAAGSVRTMAVSSITGVGTVTGVCLKHDNSGPDPDWFVQQVRVDAGSGFVSFDFGRWLAADKADGMLQACRGDAIAIIEGGGLPAARTGARRDQPALLLGLTPTAVFREMVPIKKLPLITTFSYTIEVTTGNVEGAGTSANVSIKIKGDSGETDWLTLK